MPDYGPWYTAIAACHTVNGTSHHINTPTASPHTGDSRRPSGCIRSLDRTAAAGTELPSADTKPIGGSKANNESPPLHRYPGSSSPQPSLAIPNGSIRKYVSIRP